MRWTERQRAMLREIGIPPFWPEEPVVPVEAAASVAEMATSPARADTVRPPSATATSSPAGPADVQTSAAAPSPARPPAKAPASTFVQAAAALSDVGLGTRPEGIDRMDWPALRDAVSNCRA